MVNNSKKLLKIPFEYEMIKILKKNHDDREHIGSLRAYNEIIDEGYYWKSIKNDINNYIHNCVHCIRSKGGISI